MTVPAHVIVNATSGTGCPQGWDREVEDKFRARGIEAKVHLLRSGGEISGAVDRVISEGATLVIAAGGDGTVSAVASRLADRDVTLGVLPMGTLNHFAKDLGLPLELDEAIGVIAQAHDAQVDMGEVNGRLFINNSSLGLYPDIVLDRERQRQRLGRGKWMALLAASVTAARRYPVLSLHLEVDGRPMERRSPFLFVGNNLYQMEGFEIGEREGLTDGRLSLYVTQRTGRFGLLALAFRALLRRLKQADDFDMVSAAQVVVQTRRRRMRVSADGEVLTLETPLRYRIRPGALRVRVRVPIPAA